jgi:hypothetical protein
LDARDGRGRGEGGIDGDVAIFVFEEGEFVSGRELGDEIEDEGCEGVRWLESERSGCGYWSFRSLGSR